MIWRDAPTSSNPFVAHQGLGMGRGCVSTTRMAHERYDRVHGLYSPTYDVSDVSASLPGCLSGQKRERGPRSQSSNVGGVRIAAGRGPRRVENAHASGQHRPGKRGEAVVTTRGRDIQAPGGGQRLDFPLNREISPERPDK